MVLEENLPENLKQPPRNLCGNLKTPTEVVFGPPVSSRRACYVPDMSKPTKTGGSGYTGCACRDCFDIAVSNDVQAPGMCWECGEAGCEADSECSRDAESEGGSLK